MMAQVVTNDGGVADLAATAQKLDALLASLPVEVILMWISAHADDEEAMDKVNSLAFFGTSKYRQWRIASTQQAASS